MLSQVIVRVRPLSGRETFLGKQSLAEAPLPAAALAIHAHYALCLHTLVWLVQEEACAFSR